MNQGNVEAIARCLTSSLQGDWQMTDTQVQLLAHRMAESGCLMPSALTDHAATAILAMDLSYNWPSIDAAGIAQAATDVRARLERIARGDEGA